jgi:hypothetical protein
MCIKPDPKALCCSHAPAAANHLLIAAMGPASRSDYVLLQEKFQAKKHSGGPRFNLKDKPSKEVVMSCHRIMTVNEYL